ncbi:MAG TPA: hypothetical protein EYG11_12405, partial [Candidatus Latescibacteria bacterium]|nr:hypothetical protein [Candidatus Latescibacterota bacterium]
MHATDFVAVLVAEFAAGDQVAFFVGVEAFAEDQLMDFASFNELIGVEERLELVRRLQEVE